jgi:glycosyltransferase involved in cell wall biosynthesis
MTRQPRLGIVVSHPIQYHAPLYRLLAASTELDLHVIFLSDHGVHDRHDPGFGRPVDFGVPLTDGFSHEFLNNRSPTPDINRLFGVMDPAIMTALRRSRFDAILVHGWSHIAEVMAIVTALARRIPYMLRGEATIASPAATSAGRRLAKTAFLRPLVRHAAACLSIGSRNRAFYQAEGVPEDRLFEAPYSVDNAFFADAGAKGRANRQPMLSSVGLDPALPLILFAAKLQPWKRPLDVARAYDRVATPANLVFIGDGPLRGSLDDYASTHEGVRVLGFMDQHTLGQWYGAADITVLPSEVEPWGLMVNESMAAGAVPVVSDRVGCAPDLVTPETGRVVPTGDSKSLAGALDELISAPAELAAMSAAAQNHIARYDIAAAAAGIERATIAVAAKK